MNSKDHKWLEEKKKQHPEWFKEVRVLELGSRTLNGTVRDYFENCEEYVGVDWIDGQDVDVVCYAHETKFKKEHFDILISFSMLEHDDFWKKSLSHNIPFLKRGGIIMLSWAGIGSIPHGVDYGTDQEKFEGLPNAHSKVKKLMKEALMGGKHYFPKSMKQVADFLEENNVEILEKLTEWQQNGRVHKVLAIKK